MSQLCPLPPDEPAPPNVSETSSSPSDTPRLDHKPVRASAYIVSSLVAAGCLWLVVQTTFPFFVAQLGPARSGTPGPPPPELLAQLARVRVENTVLLFALLGAMLAPALAAAAGRRSWRGAVVRVCGSVLIGAAGGAVAGWCAQRIFETPLPQHVGDTFGIVAIYAVAWSVTGIAIGCAASLDRLSLRTMSLSVFAALLAGLAAAFAYALIEAVAGIIWPALGSGELLPNGGLNRFFWFATPAVLMGLATAWARFPAAHRT